MDLRYLDFIFYLLRPLYSLRMLLQPKPKPKVSITMKNRKEFNLLIWITVQVSLFYLLLCVVCFHGSKSLFKPMSTDLGSCFIKKEQKRLYYVNDVESFQVLCMLFILSMQCDRDSVYQWVLQGKTEQPIHSDCDTSDEWV